MFGVAVVGAIFSGCAARHLPFVSFQSNVTAPRTVGVLPFDNQTNSIPGALYLRKVIHQNLERKGYVALPLDETDHALSEKFGISLGGQITEEIIPAIGKTLGVDALITGTVQKFGAVLALSAEEEVEGTFVLYETATGKKIWDFHKRIHKRIRTGQESADFLGGLAFGFLLNMAGKPLFPAVQEFVEEFLVKMPNGAEMPRKGKTSQYY